MRKKLLLFICLITLSITSTAVGVYASSEIKLFIYGKQVQGNIRMIDGKGYVAVRDVAQWLDKGLTWDDSNREIHIGKRNIAVEGTSLKTPATMGSKAMFEKHTPFEPFYQGYMQVVEVVRGPETKKLMDEVKEYNQAYYGVKNHDEPQEGMELLLAKITLKITTNADNEGKVDIGFLDFGLVSSTGKNYERLLAMPPRPWLKELSVGEETTGWVVLQVDVDDKDPIITYKTYLAQPIYLKTS
ncbi:MULTISPECIES: hypothetical protein [unclassified Paenibacillus]|uniref:hypothetical protein n=1 Tax=unclassified Paenibacillus TaxID=185978 RepID=UPI0036270D37